MLPDTLDELVTLPGIGRKTANVILGNAFDVPGITVDTHFGRLVRRWGWTDEDDPVKIEHAVGALVPKRDWTMLSHRVIFHGRRVCHARKPACGACPLAADCPSYGAGPDRPGTSRGAGQGPGGRAPAGHGRPAPDPNQPDAAAGGGRAVMSRLRRSEVAATVLVVVLAAVGVFALWPRTAGPTDQPPGPQRRGVGGRARRGPHRGSARRVPTPNARRPARERPADRRVVAVPRRTRQPSTSALRSPGG